MKLSRNPDGSYRGTYMGQELTVRKERILGSVDVWTARSGTFVYQNNVGAWNTRERAVKGLLKIFDMAAVKVPEVEALLKRWAEQVKAIAPLLNEQDIDAYIQLQSLSSALEGLDEMVRSEVVRFEKKLAKLIQHAEQHKLVEQEME